MSETNPSKKRRRTNSIAKHELLPDDALPTLTPLNYEDGNVIIKTYTRLSAVELANCYRDGRIAIQDSLDEAIHAIPADGLDGLIQYKVHRGLLTAHSTVFSDHFRGKQTILTGRDEEHEGNTVITLVDEYDVERQVMNDFLRFIYVPEYLNDIAVKLGRIPMLHTLWRVLIAAEKYGSPYIREIAKGHLERQYPPKLSHWNRAVTPYPGPIEAALAIRIAMDHKIGSILPALLYSLSTVLGVFDGFATPGQQRDFDDVLAPFTAKHLRIFFGGSSTLYSQSNFRLEKLAASNDCATCLLRRSQPRIPNCVEAFSGIVRPNFALPGSPPMVYRTRFPLDRFDQIESFVGKSAVICTECKKAFIYEIKAAKLQFWKDLPRIFNISDLVGEGWGSD